MSKRKKNNLEIANEFIDPQNNAVANDAINVALATRAGGMITRDLIKKGEQILVKEQSKKD